MLYAPCEGRPIQRGNACGGYSYAWVFIRAFLSVKYLGQDCITNSHCPLILDKIGVVIVSCLVLLTTVTYNVSRARYTSQQDLGIKSQLPITKNTSHTAKARYILSDKSKSRDKSTIVKKERTEGPTRDRCKSMYKIKCDHRPSDQPSTSIPAPRSRAPMRLLLLAYSLCLALFFALISTFPAEPGPTPALPPAKLCL